MKKIPFLFYFISCLFLNGFAATFTTYQAGSFSDPCTWSSSCSGGIPGASDDVVLNHTVAMDLTAGSISIKSLSSSWSNGILNITGSNSLNVTNDVIFQGSSTELNIGNATLNIGGNLTINQSKFTSGNLSGIAVTGNNTITASTFTVGTNSTYTVTGTSSITDATVQINGGSTVNFNNTLSISNVTTITVEGGTTVNVAGATTTNGGTMTVKNGGVVNLNNTVTLQGAGLTMNVNNGGIIDINSTLTVTGGVNILNIDGYLEVNNIIANGGSQQINIGATGTFRVINNANINSGDSGSANFTVSGGGKFLINGNLDVGNTGSAYTVTGILAVGGAITGNGNGPLLTNPNVFQGSAAWSYLPIQLVYFQAKNVGSMNELTWQTASETNNHFFTVERSNDGQNFLEVTEIRGAGNSHTKINYSFTDYYQSTFPIYYRLKQTDFDGHTTCSNIVAVKLQNRLTIASCGGLIKLGTEDISGSANITICNIIGQVVYQKILEIENNGTAEIIFNAPAGLYFIGISQNGLLVASNRFYHN